MPVSVVTWKGSQPNVDLFRELEHLADVLPVVVDELLQPERQLVVLPVRSVMAQRDRVCQFHFHRTHIILEFRLPTLRPELHTREVPKLLHPPHLVPYKECRW